MKGQKQKVTSIDAGLFNRLAKTLDRAAGHYESGVK